VRRRDVVSSTDVALLRALGRERSVVRASRRAGISRDRAVYRLGRLARAFGGPVVSSVRGGAGHGGTSLTVLGDKIVRGGLGSLDLLDARPAEPLAAPNILRGTYRRAPAPEVRLGRGLRLRVAFDADDGAAVAVALDPEAVVLARRRFPSSARNVVRGRVESVRPVRGPGDLTATVRAGPQRLRVALTDAAVRELGVRRGAAVWLYVKATALRRLDPAGRASRGRPRS
jgi:molybdate transport system regulatory protein